MTPEPRIEAQSAHRLSVARFVPYRALHHPRLLGWTPIDWIQLAYALITGIVIALHMDRVPRAGGLLVGHIAVIAAVLGLRWVPRVLPPPIQFLRDAYPLLLLELWYQETALLSRAFTISYHDGLVQRWDMWVFGRHWNAELAALVPSAFVSEFLHGCYLLYIACIPALGITLYASRRYEAFRVFATTVMATFLTCYLCFVFLPVMGPYYAMARPAVQSFGVFPPLVYAMLASAASFGAAFPSSHVAGSVVVAFLAWRFERRLFPFLAVLALGIAVGTVYGGFHYAIDALAGLLVGVIFAFVGPRLHATLLRSTRRGRIPLRGTDPRFADPPRDTDFPNR